MAGAKKIGVNTDFSVKFLESAAAHLSGGFLYLALIKIHAIALQYLQQLRSIVPGALVLRSLASSPC